MARPITSTGSGGNGGGGGGGGSGGTGGNKLPVAGDGTGFFGPSDELLTISTAQLLVNDTDANKTDVLAITAVQPVCAAARLASPHPTIAIL